MMMQENIFNYLIFGWILAGIPVFLLLFSINAPYGRHVSSKWGVMISNRLGWIIMESPPLWLFSFFFFTGNVFNQPVNLCLFAFWIMHYINRDLIFPFRIKSTGKKMPVSIMLFALIFNGFNGFFNGYYLGHIANYASSWFYDPRFIAGLLLFIGGAFINIYSDNILIKLRKNAPSYQIPQRGLFRYISSPNYTGEIVEWIGYAMMSWSLAGLSFAVWTIANLLPRAVSNHKWYKKQFSNYPKNRKAVIPGIW